MDKRNSKLIKNTMSSMVFQFTAITCGFIVPRLILKSYGSEVNGLVNSISQFLTIVAFLEFGVGAVVQSSLQKVFKWTQWILHNLTVFLFGCTGCLIVPFVMFYTNGVQDANYYQPIFAIILVSAHSCHCLRLPYNMMILAAEHYKQTQNIYIIETILDLCVSIMAIKVFGFVGVALGALCALSYQVLWMARYNVHLLI